MLLKSLSIRAKLLLVLGTLGILLAATAGGGWFGTSSMYASIATIYADRVVPLRDLKVVADLYAVNVVDASHKVRNGNIDWAEGLKLVEKSKSEVRERWSAYAATYMDAHEKGLAAQVLDRVQQADKTVDRLVAILRAQDAAALATLTKTELYPAIDPVSEAVSELIELQLEVAMAEARHADGVFAVLKNVYVAAAAFALLALAVAGNVVVRGVSRPLTRIADQMRRLAAGDLTITVTDAHKRDEVGTLAAALQVFKDALISKKEADEAAASEVEAKTRRAQHLDQITKQFEANISDLTRSLSASAGEMEATAQSMSAIAGQTSTRSVSVATAAEQTSANVQTVAAAVEELTISIREIASQVTQSSSIAERAVADARHTNETVQALADTAERIGDVVQLISTIAAQTNLLALNATIEAARAGEAGRGFAVVATEVKELASQTARATDEIGSQIAAIQQQTRGTVGAIQGIANTIVEMSQISAAIAAAIEEQGAATGEISRNVQDAAHGTEQVTGNIGDLRQGAHETGTAASQVLAAAQELARHSADLGREVETFLGGVKAA